MNQFKKIIFITLCILAMPFVFGYHDCVFADTGDIGVYIDGVEVDFPDIKPYISNDRTLVPIRFISEQLGASVNWNNDNGTVVISKDDDNIKLAIGSTEIVRNGISSTIDVAPVITNSRTMVPLRFVSEQLGAVVDWDVVKNSVLIATKKASSTYTVKAGDTMWHIASANGMSIEELEKANPSLDPDKLMIGQQLNLSSTSDTEEPDTSNVPSKVGDLTVSTESIDFDTSYERTDSLYRGESEVKRAGVSGMREVTSKTTVAEDGSITTEVIKTIVTLEPENQILLVGTKTPAVSRGEGKPISVRCSADEMIAYAKEYLGVPYVYGGTTPDGFDCSGFTQYVVAHFGGCLPHSSSEQYYYGISVERENLQTGDLVFFEASEDPMNIGHVGIYIGDGEFIHAPQPGENIKISSLSNVYFDQRFYGAIRMDTADTEQYEDSKSKNN